MMYSIQGVRLLVCMPQGQPLTGITYLNLHNCALRKLENLMVLRDLKVCLGMYPAS